MQDLIIQHIFKAIALVEQNNDWSFFNEIVLNTTTHDGQMDFLQNSYKVDQYGHQLLRENALHPGNGFGKTTIIARKHIFYVLKHWANGAKYRTLNIAITQDQAELVQDEILRLVQNAPFLASWFLKSSVKFPRAKITYFNDSTTEFKTTKKKAESVEGKEYGYISCDEIALEMHLEFIRDKILLPRLRAWPDSQLDFSATPKGLNAWYRVCNDIRRKGGFVRGGTSYENPFIDHKLLDYQKSTWSEAKVKQMIMGEFVDTADMMFASRVEKLFDDSLSFEEVDKGARYIEGWDLARGRKKSADQTVGFRLKQLAKHWQVTKNWAFQLPWTEKERELLKSEHNDAQRSSIEREIRNAHYESNASVYIDSTGVGDTLFGMLIDIAKGVDFRGGNKDKLLDHLQAVIDADLLKCPFIPQLADEMTLYQRDDTNLDTDYLMALAVAASSIRVKTHRKLQCVSVDVFAS